MEKEKPKFKVKRTTKRSKQSKLVHDDDNLYHKITHAYEDTIYEVGDKVRRISDGKGEKEDTGTPLDYTKPLTIVAEEVKQLSDRCVVQILYFEGDEDNPHVANDYKPL